MFCLIAAIGNNNEIGANNDLVFHLKNDMKFFRRKTLNHKVVMGENTWKSLPGKLKNRYNIVVSYSDFDGPDLIVHDLKRFIDDYKDSNEEIFVIGGGMIYAEFLPYAKKLFLTEINADSKDATVFFPSFKKNHYKKTTLEKGKENDLIYSINQYTKLKLENKMKDVVFDLIEQEKVRQTEGLELIPSENYVSKDVLMAMGSVLTNKYSEGYPSFEGIPGWKENKISTEILPNYRYYGGQTNIDRIERLCIDRACKLFHADHANVQPHSGANANEAVYFAWVNPGEKILAMDLGSGGHLTHGSPVTRSANIYNFIAYGTDENGDIDYDGMEKMALENDIKLILVGYSAFMKIPDFERVVKIHKKAEKKWGHEILLMADMAHVAGLIAAGVHPNPLDFGFNVMTTTTHKTLRGPRGGLILTKGIVGSPLKKIEDKSLKNIPTLIDKAVFPGTQGGPLEHVIAAKAVAFGEAMKPSFKTYAKKIVDNAKTLADELKNKGFVLQGDGTENHLILVNVNKSFGINGKVYEKALDYVGLTLNANALPGDKGGAFKPNGVRLGTPAITTRGMGKPEMKKIANWMEQVAKLCQTLSDDNVEMLLEKERASIDRIRQEVKDLALRFPVPGI